MVPTRCSIILGIVVLFFSCQSEKNSTPPYTVISGTIHDFDDNEITLRSDTYTAFRKIIKVDQNGYFLDTLSVPKWNRSYTLYASKPIKLYLRPYETLAITVNAAQTENEITYHGKSQSINHYLFEKNKIKTAFYERLGKNVYLFDESTYIQHQNLLKKKWRHHLQENEQNLPSEFVMQEHKDIDYQIRTNLGRYQPNHRRLTKNPDFEISEKLNRQFLDFDFDNPEQFDKSYYYQELVMTRLRNSALESLNSKKIVTPNTDATLNWLQTIASQTQNQAIKEILLAHSTKYHVLSDKTQEQKITYYDFYLRIAKDKSLIQDITFSFEKAKKLWPGSDSPTFFNYVNHDGTKTSLSDLKGTYLYIDIWATWCGPCKYEIPYYKALEKQYRGKKIAFVSISIDRPKDSLKWRRMIDDKALPGIHLLADKVYQSDFIKAYHIDGVPRYILLDPQGKIVTHNAPRPSHIEAINALFDRLKI